MSAKKDHNLSKKDRSYARFLRSLSDDEFEKVKTEALDELDFCNSTGRSKMRIAAIEHRLDIISHVINKG